MADSSPPYWVLISVLFSSQPLSSAVAMTLHEAALRLHRSERTEGKVGGDLLSGTVRNLKQYAQLGTLQGPVFEADIDTERGSGKVRFLLTREGLEALGALAEHEAAQAKAPARPRYLN